MLTAAAGKEAGLVESSRTQPTDADSTVEMPVPPPVRLRAAAGTASDDRAPRLAEGVDLIGEYEGSGFREPPALIRRGDGQVIQLSPLLYVVAKHIDGERSYGEVAEAVTEEFGRAVSADNVRTIVDEKLHPLGLTLGPDGSAPPVEKPDPLLALKFRKSVIPAHRSQAVASLFKPLFYPPVVLVALVAFVGFDAWLFLHHGVAQSFRDALYDPALILLVLGLVVLSAGWHEFGHAAGCAYGGACPGPMGAGIYIAYPAFYTDVTDSYRLGRGGRLRTDLAGVYFNALFVLATAALYALTGYEALLLVVIVQHLEMAHQLLPLLRLDGYYIVADFTGVPDLYTRIVPILTSAIPGREPDDRVRVLKPWVRVVVTVWVLVVVPLLVFQLGMLLLHAPRMVGTAWDSLAQQWDGLAAAVPDAAVLAAVSAAVQALIIVLPLVGIAYTFALLGRRGLRAGWRITDGRPLPRAAFLGAAVALVAGLVYVWLPDGDYRPIQRGERGTLAEGLVAVRRAPTGHSSLESHERAAKRGDLDVATEPGDDAPRTEREQKDPVPSSTTTTSPPPDQAPEERDDAPTTSSLTTTTNPRATTTSTTAAATATSAPSG